MNEFVSKYTSKIPNAAGYVTDYTTEENDVWAFLYERQFALMQGHACEEHIKGLEILQLSSKQIPQLPDVSAKLRNATGWSVSPVKALITAKEFFNLLAHRQFPAATFIRCREEIDYVQEPDIFHELFGHYPMLTEPV